MNLSRPRVKTIKRLFAVSGNKCYFPKCKNTLIDNGTGKVIGEICHIKGQRPGSARYDPKQTDEERHSFDNLVLMCSIHHDVIDADPNSNTVSRLKEIKEKHETIYKDGKKPSEYIINQFIHNLSENSTISTRNQKGGQVAKTIINIGYENLEEIKNQDKDVNINNQESLQFGDKLGNLQKEFLSRVCKDYGLNFIFTVFPEEYEKKLFNFGSETINHIELCNPNIKNERKDNFFQNFKFKPGKNYYIYEEKLDEIFEYINTFSAHLRHSILVNPHGIILFNIYINNPNIFYVESTDSFELSLENLSVEIPLEKIVFSTFLFLIFLRNFYKRFQFNGDFTLIRHDIRLKQIWIHNEKHFSSKDLDLFHSNYNTEEINENLKICAILNELYDPLFFGFEYVDSPIEKIFDRITNQWNKFCYECRNFFLPKDWSGWEKKYLIDETHYNCDECNPTLKEQIKKEEQKRQEHYDTLESLKSKKNKNKFRFIFSLIMLLVIASWLLGVILTLIHLFFFNLFITNLVQSSIILLVLLLFLSPIILCTLICYYFLKKFIIQTRKIKKIKDLE